MIPVARPLRFSRGGRAAMAGAAALWMVAAGCASKGGPAPAASPAIDSTTFAADLAVDLKQFTRMTSGLYFLDAVKGTGVVAAEGRKATFRYAAFLPNGSLVESQRQPLEAEIGEGMIKGLRFGIAGMRAGGQRRLVVPPALAYGRAQYGNVPPNSILVFDVELISVR
jgi:FKBP-type peptidyl-prolyl cis-trans isomerase FkpA